MSITALGSSFGYIPPAAAVRETAPASEAGDSTASRLVDQAQSIASGPVISTTTPFQRLMDRMAAAQVSIQERVGGEPERPGTAVKAYEAAARSG
ncbi:hypothetical protein C2U72_22690 [Prosthecomicrobium hirschii]|uniref:hypothetical protein n=1 Tax=Prosthecodimorpha hirschii TaxID=665126 RepID=UPI0011279B8C|nr:hypothetical protein [Prosthecomicrobium hirschii]TPQ48639.1 hypothetical protein C2U72_22690 [Prosthecomicrobium hirschii]